MAFTGHSGSHAPQSMHSSGFMNSWMAASKPGSSLRGWMQSTGQTSTHEASFRPMHGSVITYVISPGLLVEGLILAIRTRASCPLRASMIQQRCVVVIVQAQQLCQPSDGQRQVIINVSMEHRYL